VCLIVLGNLMCRASRSPRLTFSSAIHLPTQPSQIISSLAIAARCAIRLPYSSSASYFWGPSTRLSYFRSFAAAAITGTAAAATTMSASADATSSASAPLTSANAIKPCRLYVMPGSQFAAKAMVAFEATGTPYETIFVSLISRSSRQKVLPSGGFKVPEVGIPERGSDGKVTYRPLTESSKILHALDDISGTDQLYPKGDTRIVDADEHISSVINAHVMYFNHVSRAGWERSIRQVARNTIPLGPLWRLVPLHALYGSMRDKTRSEVATTLSLDEWVLTDERMTESLIVALERYEIALKHSSGKNIFLYSYSKPTAADCALFAMVSRFVDSMGDAKLPGSLPDLFYTAGNRLEKLSRWFERMQHSYPMHWYAKKVDA
jgi:glutathione S-transferase